MTDILAQAIDMHQTGQFTSAARLYQQVLACEQENADALHLLGVLRHQQGDHEKAVELIRQAIALRPSVPAFHANLAEAFRALGQFERAAGSCRMALRLWPDYPEALGNLALALQGLGRLDEAAERFHQALRLRPNAGTFHNGLGTVLRDLKRIEEALASFQRAVECEPQLALAQSNLGQLLLELGRAEEALPHAVEAVRLQPDLAAAHNNLGNVLRTLNRFVEARAAYAEALRLDSDLAAAMANLGLTLQREGQFADALPWMQQAVELEPDNAAWWENLAELRMDREEPAEAVACYMHALSLRPERAATHNGLGWALQEEGRLTEATQHFRTALQLDPQMGGAQLNLGGVHEELGELTEAEEAFRAALRIQRRFALAHARLATLLRGKLPDADRAALEERLADPKLSGEPRAQLLFGLAQVLDGRGDYVRAAECLREANVLTLEEAKHRHREYDPAKHTEFVDKMVSACDPAFFARLQGSGSDRRRPIFVFGLPRSGTTLIEQMLASHSRIHGAGELRLVRRSFESIPALLGRSEWPVYCLPHVDGSTVGRLAEQHLEWLHGYDEGRAAYIVDKMPDNYMYLGLIAVMFPNAVLIHCRRDLRDVAVSCWMTNFRSILWANDFEHLATRFTQYRRVMDHWRTVLPVTIHEANYEDVVSDFEGVARRLVAACGLEWEPACLDFHRLRRPVRTASATQVRRPIYSQSVARWRNYEAALAELFVRLPATDRPAGDELFHR
ncbi:MAG TPA: tetratricopeptide repeat protein [Gemmataceae bacterium]|nr:tetratricopeptide repeat protein [Gemmataceae bacterium]